MLVGLAGRRSRLPNSNYLLGGFLIGGILPDMDFLPLIFTYIFDRNLAVSFHRSFSHSFLTAGAVILVGLCLPPKQRRLVPFYIACGFGMVIHSILDLFMWFAPVKIFWPFGGDYSIWNNILVPDTLWNMMSSLECVSYALFIVVFFRIIKTVPSIAYKSLLVLLPLFSIILLPIGYKLSRIEFEWISYGIAIIFGFIPSVMLIKKYWQHISMF